MNARVGRCHDCTAPQTEVNMLSRHILELQKDKGELTDRVRELEAEVKEWKDKADLWCKTANLKDHNIMINKELEKENAELKEKLEKATTHRISNCNKAIEWQTGIPIKKWEIFARTVANCNLLATYFDGAWRNVWNGGIIDFDKITMWRYTGFKNNGEEIDFKELAE